MICVISGSSALKPAKISWKRGMKNTIRKISTPSASTSRMIGYISAVITFDFSSFSRAWKSAICASTRSRKPPVSPASTIAT